MKTLIKNAQIFNGLGSPSFRGEILLEGKFISRISAIAIDDFADQVIDAEGKFLAPGFIDCHSHCDLANFIPQGMKIKIMQGVTTEVSGVCGLGVAPVKLSQQKLFRKQLIIGDQSIDWNWESFDDYLKALERTALESNLVPLIPHGVLRHYIKGDASSALNPSELNQLELLLEQCFKTGARGVSLGLIYLPAIYSAKAELAVIFEVAQRYDRLVMVHLRSESDEIVEALDEMIELAKGQLHKLHISHLKVIGARNAHKLNELFQRIETHHLSFDHYPFCFGSTTLLSIIPPHYFKGKSLDEVLNSFAQKDVRDEIVNYFNERIELPSGEPWDNLPALVGWENIDICDLNKSIAELAAEKGMEPAHYALDYLQAQGGNVLMVDRYMDESLLYRIFAHPASMVGTDTLLSKTLHPRAYGSFPKIIQEFVFKRGVLSLEKAIEKMTSIPARRLGLGDRGSIEEGKRADLVIFDDRFHLPEKFGDSTNLEHLWINGCHKVSYGQYQAAREGMICLGS